jgi:DNA-binding NarL/FixJ family response regulator
MEAAHARAAMTLVSPSSGVKPRVGAVPVAILPQVPSSETKLRVLIAERRASAHSELSRRLDRAGHEVLARVTSGQGTLDYAELLRPDVVLIAPVLEDGPGIMAAIALTRELPGVAAVVLTAHPAAVNPAARPNWGAVSLVPADAEPEDLDAELRRAVAQAREAVATAVVPEQVLGSQPRPADLAPVTPATPQYQTPIPEVVDPLIREPRPVGPTVPTRSVVPPGAAARPGVIASAAGPSAPVLQTAMAPSEPIAPKPDTKPAPKPSPAQGGRSPLSFTDEDLLAIGPFVDPPAPSGRPSVAAPPSVFPSVSSPAPAAPVVSAAPSPAPALTPPVPSPVELPTLYDMDTAVITEAAECLLERTGLSRSDAMRLMEQEAADTGRTLIEVAQSVLGRDGEGSGSEMALAS